MTSADFRERSKDETIEYLVNAHNSMEHQMAELRQELAEARETIEEFKRMIFASRSEKKHVGYENPEQLTLMDLFNEAELAADSTVEEPTAETIVKGYIRKQEARKRRRLPMKSFMTSFHQETFCATWIQMRRSAHDAVAPWSVSAGRKSVPNWRLFRLRSVS